MNEIRKIVRQKLNEGSKIVAVRIEDPNEIQKLELFRDKNFEVLGVQIPSGWKQPSDYHMTVKLGTLPLGMKMRGDLDQEVELQVETLGVSSQAVAFGVTGYLSKNEQQHITLGFEFVPSESNNIQDWEELPYPFTLKGVIREYTM